MTEHGEWQVNCRNYRPGGPVSQLGEPDSDGLTDCLGRPAATHTCGMLAIETAPDQERSARDGVTAVEWFGWYG